MIGMGEPMDSATLVTVAKSSFETCCIGRVGSKRRWWEKGSGTYPTFEYKLFAHMNIDAVWRRERRYPDSKQPKENVASSLGWTNMRTFSDDLLIAPCLF
jgi:hypothetical protein